MVMKAFAFSQSLPRVEEAVKLAIVSIASALSILPYQLSSFAEYHPDDEGT